MTLPKLKSDTERLYRVYYTYDTMDSKDFVNEFQVSRRTACKIIKAGKRKPDDRYISVERLFSLYGWDIASVTEKYRELRGAV